MEGLIFRLEYLIPAVEAHRHRPVPDRPMKFVHTDLAYVLPRNKVIAECLS